MYRSSGHGSGMDDITEKSEIGLPTVTMSASATATSESESSSLFNISEWVNTKSQDALIRILSAGPIPRHVGFVMDGNRRFARRQQRAVQEGHAEGYVALRRVRSNTLRTRIVHDSYLSRC